MDNPPLVLIHGLKGSHLRDTTTNRLRYLTLNSLFNLNREDQFPLPTEREDGGKGAQMKDNLVSEGILRDVRACNKVLATFYGPFIDWVEKDGR